MYSLYARLYTKTVIASVDSLPGCGGERPAESQKDSRGAHVFTTQTRNYYTHDQRAPETPQAAHSGTSDAHTPLTRYVPL